MKCFLAEIKALNGELLHPHKEEIFRDRTNFLKQREPRKQNEEKGLWKIK